MTSNTTISTRSPTKEQRRSRARPRCCSGPSSTGSPRYWDGGRHGAQESHGLRELRAPRSVWTLKAGHSSTTCKSRSTVGSFSAATAGREVNSASTRDSPRACRTCVASTGRCSAAIIVKQGDPEPGVGEQQRMLGMARPVDVRPCGTSNQVTEEGRAPGRLVDLLPTATSGGRREEGGRRCSIGRRRRGTTRAFLGAFNEPTPELARVRHVHVLTDRDGKFQLPLCESGSIRFARHSAVHAHREESATTCCGEATGLGRNRRAPGAGDGGENRLGGSGRCGRSAS